MKPGLRVGANESIIIVVTNDMFAAFEGKVIHPVYSTVAMTYHMEWVSRKIILPFLESTEEGIGASVLVKHISPALAGSEVTLTATLIELKNNIVSTKIEAYQDTKIIGVGEVKQVILPKEKIEGIFHGKAKDIH